MCGRTEDIQLYDGEVLIRFSNGKIYRREKIGEYGLAYALAFVPYPEADGDYGVPLPDEPYYIMTQDD